MSILERAMAMQREQENFAADKAKVNAEQSRAKGANKKKLFMDHSADDDEFEVAGNAYTMTDETIKKVNTDIVRFWESLVNEEEFQYLLGF